jgi:hypothetical protein
MSAALFTLLHGFVGVVAGVPIAFAINVTRRCFTSHALLRETAFGRSFCSA